MFFLRASTSTAPASYAGAMITSVKMSATVSAISTLTSVLAAITPPNARQRIAFVGLAVRVGHRHRRDGDAARIGVLDDRHADLFVVERRPPGGIGIGVVVVGHLFSVQLLGLGKSRPPAVVAVERGLLMRVLPVPQHGLASPRRTRPQRQRRWSGVLGREHRRIQAATATSYSAVCRNPASQLLPLLEGEPAGTHCGEHTVVSQRIDDHGDAGMVLGGGAHHRGPADVDLLDAFVYAGTRFNGLSDG